MANIEIPDVAKQAQLVVEGVLGDSIIGIYLFGSAVVGGLKRDSDVDILVVVTNPPTFEQKEGPGCSVNERIRRDWESTSHQAVRADGDNGF